jgi:broad specificity phosphatase PhoE
MKLYLIRHWQTEANEGCVCSTPTSLSENGVRGYLICVTEASTLRLPLLAALQRTFAFPADLRVIYGVFLMRFT